MSIDLCGYEETARNAVRAFWKKRTEATDKQQTSGTADRGERAGVTAGKNMDGFNDRP